MTSAQLAAATSADGFPPAVRALWHDARGQWDEAHRLAQQDAGVEGDWVHAYLHRKEGDLSNAAYWYRRAGRPLPAQDVTLEAEWDAISSELLRDLPA